MARKILLADDSVTAQNMGRKILTEAGYEVVTVNNGAAALKKISEIKPDLIVLDVYMPGYGGLEVCQRLKESTDTARLPILLTVGKLEPFKSDDAKRVRADAHIVKPFEASELLTAINKLEDRIVPQGQTKKFGRQTRKSTIEPDGAELQDGWRDRLPRGAGKDKKAAALSTTEEAQPENSKVVELRTGQFGDEISVTAESSKPLEVPRSAASVASHQQPAAETSTPGLEEKNRSPRASAQTVAAELGSLSEAKPVEDIASEGRNISPAVSAKQVASPLAENEVAEVLSALVPVHGNENGASFVGSADLLPAGLTGARWIAEEVPVSAEECALNLEQEMERFQASSNPACDNHEVAPEPAAPESPALEATECRLPEPDPLICELQAPAPNANHDIRTENARVNQESPQAPAIGTVPEPAPVASSEQPVAPPAESVAYAAAAGAGTSVTSPQPSSSSETPSAQLGIPSCEVPGFETWDQLRDTFLREQNMEPSATNAETEHCNGTPEQGKQPEKISALDTEAITSIVESVLADLKPKLIAVIMSRMGKSS